MRSFAVVEAASAVIQANKTKIDTIINTFAGGWEAWLQVETALALQKALQVRCTAAREVPYPFPPAPPAPAPRADIMLHPSAGQDIYFELKVRNAPNDNIVIRFSTDVTKIMGLSPQTRSACVPVAMGYLHFVTPADINNINHQTLSMGGGKFAARQLGQSGWTDVTGSLATATADPMLVSYRLTD